jgi:1,5-anhydro-D-fructose reductase (1,5-anhydro-D-mannitol-forming)
MKTIRWALAGVGDIAKKRVIPAILAEPRSRLAGVVTSDRSKASIYGVAAWDSLEEALPHVDAVYLATPVFLHAPQTFSALRAGKHVLCEKPMAMNYEEACLMQRAAEESGLTFGVAYYRRTYPKVQRVRELIAEGAIGQPVVAEFANHYWFTAENGFRGWLIQPDKSGGGPLYDIASHRIDLLNYLFGRPLRAKGLLGNAVHQYRVEDNATVMIDYPGGVRGIVDVRWHSRVERDECRIRGTGGEINLTPLNGPDLVHPRGHELLPNHSNLHYPCIENFVDAVLERKPLLATGATSLLTDWVTAEVLR